MYYNADFEKIYETKEEFKAALDEVVELYRQNSFLDKKDKKPKQDIKKNKVENPIIYPNNEMKTELDNFLRLYERVCFDKGKEAGNIETLILLVVHVVCSRSKKQSVLLSMKLPKMLLKRRLNILGLSTKICGRRRKRGAYSTDSSVMTSPVSSGKSFATDFPRDVFNPLLFVL
jgi:hypothetical protein